MVFWQDGYSERIGVNKAIKHKEGGGFGVGFYSLTRFYKNYNQIFKFYYYQILLISLSYLPTLKIFQAI